MVIKPFFILSIKTTNHFKYDICYILCRLNKTMEEKTMKTKLTTLVLCLGLTSSIVTFGQGYVDDIYYNPDTDKSSVTKEYNKPADTNYEEPADTVFYSKSTKNSEGEITSYEEGYYLDDNADNNDYTYTKRLNRYHGSTIIIDDYDDYYYGYNWGVNYNWYYPHYYTPGWSIGFGYYNPWYGYPYYGYSYGYYGYGYGYYYPYYSYPYYYSHHYPYYSGRNYYHTENARRDVYRGSNTRYNGTRNTGRAMTTRSVRSSSSTKSTDATTTRSSRSGASNRSNYETRLTNTRNSNSDSYRSSNNNTRSSNDSYRSSGSSSRSSGGSYRSSGGSSRSGSSFGGGRSSGGSRGGGRR